MNKTFWKKISLIVFGSCLNFTAFAISGQAYLEKFMQYRQWSEHLPSAPDQAFLTFISGTTPLSKKLREKWLYQLAYDKNWKNFSRYYQPSTDVGLQCYAQMALYQQGQQHQALSVAKKLWLNGASQPKPCDQLFALLLKDHAIDEKLIHQRIVLALEKRNLSLAIYLLKQYSPARLTEVKLLTSIAQNPKRIAQIGASALHSEFYLYGLKQIASKNIKQALPYWQLAKKQHLLSYAQQQEFISHIAICKAVHNQPDASEWFAKVDPNFYNDALLDWQIRVALKAKKWRRVEQLITRANNKDSLGWQFWLARALEAQGQKEKAKVLYQNIAKIRNYYGFLASLRLKTALSFENENTTKNKKILQPYRPITNQIYRLYNSKQKLQASRLLNDFICELPKEDRSALVYWVANDLQWHGKSVDLSNNEPLSNQLLLRFPLAHQQTVNAYAKHYQISKELIYAIIRQESAFREDVVSPAGAHGLMQIMPATAKAISKQQKITYSDKKQLFSSQKNIQLGAAYLQQLTKRFHNHPILIAAAYNAGPRQAVFWLKNHPPEDIDVWIETLPWQETRNYLKNVLAFYAVYQYRLQEKPNLAPFMQHL